jgi:predicted phage-related endonuclease
MSLTQAQKAMRRTGISGSQVAAICGLHPYVNALDVWREKVLGEETPETLAMEIGSAFEDGILNLYARRKNILTIHKGTTVRHAKHPLIIATPDALVGTTTDMYPVEAKNTAQASAFEDWGEDGTDAIAEWHRPQVTFEAAVTGAAFTDVAAVLARPRGGWDFRIYRVPFDEEYFQALREMAEKFFTDYVTTETPPPPDGSEAWSDFLKTRFPLERAPLLQATEADEALARQYLEADAMLEAAETAKRLARQQLELRCAEAAGMRGSCFSLSWKSTKPVRKVRWEELVMHLGVKSDVVEQFTETRPGSRPFRLTKVREKSNGTGG